MGNSVTAQGKAHRCKVASVRVTPAEFEDLKFVAATRDLDGVGAVLRKWSVEEAGKYRRRVLGRLKEG